MLSCSYIKSEFDKIANINKVKFSNSNGESTKTLNINKDTIDYLISLLYDLREEGKSNA